MSNKGKLTTWKDERGFGFIKPDDGSKFVNKPGCNIKGNISHNTGSKVYHLPGMEDYESTVIDPTKGERWFCSESEAIASGWRKAPR